MCSWIRMATDVSGVWGTWSYPGDMEPGTELDIVLSRGMTDVMTDVGSGRVHIESVRE